MDRFTLDKIEFDAVRGVLAEFCRCSLGKALARRIAPSRNPETINHWLTQTSQMVAALRDFGTPPFGGVTDITETMHRARPGGEADGNDFAQIASVLEGSANVRDYLHALPEELEQLQALAEGLGDFAGEVRATRSIVAPDGSVMDSASERLAGVRREIASTTQHIHDVIYGYLRQAEVAKLLQNATVTLHGDRYVLPVKYTNRGRLPGVVHRESQSGQTVFVEPAASVELNNRLSDLREDERQEIRRLLGQLSIRLQGRSEAILAALQTLGQVDLVAAKAQYAYQYEMTCPLVSERGDLQFDQARHPLLAWQARRQEQAGWPAEKRHAVVPIDVRLGSDFDLLVITGSNTGGKTVTLKTVALLAVMAQCGMHIPARRGARMPLLQDVFIDIGDEQSLQQSLSTFGAHIKRIRYILSKAQTLTLVLLDELGSGTDPDEGGAIGQAVLDALRQSGCLGMVTTHLGVLKAYAMTHERVDNASVEFDTATLSPTYELLIGTPGESHALTVAQKLGLPKAIVSAARSHLAGRQKQFHSAIRATGAARQTAEEARTAYQTAQLAAKVDQENYQAKLTDLHQLREEFNTWLARLPELRAGDDIFVPSLNRTGHLVRVEWNKQVALVTVDKLDVEVPLSQLMPDLGQSAVRQQINALREQIQEQVQQTQQVLSEAQHKQKQCNQTLLEQRERARQFDTWLGAVGRLRVGDEVPIAIKPGRGKLLAVDLPALKAKVQTEMGEMELSIQDIFPQTGPFAPQPAGKGHRDNRHGSRQHLKGPADKPGSRRQGVDAQGELVESEEPNRPVHRRGRDDKQAAQNRSLLLATQPGQAVYVVPFHKRATLIRINTDKELALVQAGAFEMQVPLADLEPVR